LIGGIDPLVLVKEMFSTQRSLALLTLLFVLTLPGTADAAPRGDSAVGHNVVTRPSGHYQRITVSAHSGPAGQNPTGSVTVNFRLFDDEGRVNGKVTCLDVIRNEARVAARLSRPHDGATHVILLVFDQGKAGQGEPDRVFFEFTSSPPAGCAGSGSTLVGDVSGNVTVRDATSA
jgi:hypothetical protein